MQPREFPILEFDPEPRSIIEPSELIVNCGAPEVCIIPFYYQVIQKLSKAGILKEITHDRSIATDILPLYEMEFQGKRIAVMTSGLGAAFSAGMLEFAIACGCKKFLVIGSGGVLEKTIERDQLIVPTTAIRDEGTSYHYYPPSREIALDLDVVANIKDFLDRKEIKYMTGKTWTTDAFFRETPEKIQARKKEGAIILEMEAAALIAVAKFRHVKLGYILGAGDDVSGIEWDSRGLMKSTGFQEKFFWMAAELATEL